MNSVKSHKFIFITVIIAIVMVVWQTLAGALDYRFQLVFFIVTIFTLGIPHGAFDYTVDQELARRDKSLFHGFAFRLKYLLAIVIYGVFWYFIPQVSLLTFLLMSAWHFGETDLRKTIAWPVFSDLGRLIYGISILSWIIFGHATEAETIIKHLIPTQSVMFALWLTGVARSEIILSLSLFIILTGLSINYLQRKSNDEWWIILQLIIILTCCYFLPLLPAFALYFVGWHSIITLNNIGGFINSGIANKPLTIAKLCVKAIPASLMAIGSLLIIGYLFRHYAPIFDPLPLLFVFLSLITLPHMQVMYKLNQMIYK